MDKSQWFKGKLGRKGRFFNIETEKHVLVKIQAGQWVESWQQHLVDRATPKDLVDVIVAKKKTLGKAKKLEEEIIKKFNMDNNPRPS